MDSLSDELKSLGVKLGAKQIAPRKIDYPIELVVPGEYLYTNFGEVFHTESFYPDSYMHGSAALRSQYQRKMIAEWGHSKKTELVDPKYIYFLDTETTGLAGGVGTYAFLVGVGCYTDDGFHLSQFFLKDPHEENALLDALSKFLFECQVLVTFNGKSFDVPLLNTRFTLRGMTSPVTNLDHLDLLQLARRLWRDRLPSRALNYLEVNILGANRTQDEVPGWMIPELYFEFLRTGDARPLQGVFYHNAMDILSLAALFSHTTSLLEKPLSLLPQPGLDLVALGRLYEDLGHLDTAIRLYEIGLEQGLPENFLWSTIERFATLYKRRKDWSQALPLWRRAAEHGQIYAYTEIAKYYEHEKNDVAQAIFWTQGAIEQLSPHESRVDSQNQYLPELQHRLDRLNKKRRNEVEQY